MIRAYRKVIIVCLVVTAAVFLTTYYRFPIQDISTSLEKICTPRKDLVFLKTHKCAGSTLMNIFLRFGLANNLTFVIPKALNTHYLGHPMLFNRILVEDLSPYNVSYNILTHHTRFNRMEIERLMPMDTVYLTILRKPESVFESLYSYCRLANLYKKNLTGFLNDSKLIESLQKMRVVGGKVGFNQMSFDLGFDEKLFNSTEAITYFIGETEEVFDLVMIADRFDESLVLMKHLLCWSTEDVVVFKLNARHDKYRTSLSKESVEKLRELNRADALLYDYFHQKFEKLVIEFGVDRLAEEVLELQTLTNYYKNRCVLNQDTADKVIPKEMVFRREVMAFRLKENSSLCKHLTYTELEFHKIVRNRHLNMIKELRRIR